MRDAILKEMGVLRLTRDARQGLYADLRRELGGVDDKIIRPEWIKQGVILNEQHLALEMLDRLLEKCDEV